MKQIQPISIWSNGNYINASVLNFYVINDNLNNNAIFYYALFSGTVDQIEIKLSDGNLLMEGQDYINYSTSQNSIEYAYNYAAQKLNLQII